ncbi:MAG: PA14 domain-containing protein, partial [Gemmatimonadaceae bacterium]
MLKNESRRLPLGNSARRIAVIGRDAVEGRADGYAPPGARLQTLLDGIREGAPKGSVVRYADGVPRLAPTLTAVPPTALRRPNGAGSGLDGEYFDNITLGGEPRLRRTDDDLRFAWTLSPPAASLPLDWYSVRWTGTIV